MGISLSLAALSGAGRSGPTGGHWDLRDILISISRVKILRYSRFRAELKDRRVE